MPSITDDAPTLDDVIRLYVIGVCVACEWNVIKVANVLDVSIKTVYTWLHKYEEDGYLTREVEKPGWKKMVWKLRRKAA